MSKYIKLLSTGALLFSAPLAAYHFPWDQGHDTTVPNTPSNEPGTGEHESEDNTCETGSPVYLKTGHFVWDETDVVVGNATPLKISRIFNSNDPKDGPFGKGWTFNCEASLYKVTDTQETSEGTKTTSEYVYRVGNGRRLTFNANESGGYTSPKRLKAKLKEGNVTTLEFANGRSMTFSKSGQLLSKTDKNGNAITYGYDANQRLVSISNDFFQSLTLDYNATGRVKAVTDQAGRTWFYSYSNDGELISVTDPLGHEQTYQYTHFKPTYDAHVYSQLNKITDSTGVEVTSVVYNGAKVQSYTEGSNQFTYSYSGEWITKTDSVGSKWRFKLNEQGQRIEDIDPLDNKVVRVRDANGYVTSTTDSLGIQKTIVRDAESRVIASDNGNLKTEYQYTGKNVYPDSVTYSSISSATQSRSINFSYDSRGNLLSFAAPNQHTTVLEYNENGLVTKATDPEGNRTTFTYTPQGQLASVTDALNRVHSFTYDQYGYLAEKTDASGDVYRFSTDALGRILSSSDAAGLTTKFTYDAAGRLKSVTAPNNAVESYTYDAYGRLSTLTSYNLETEYYTYRQDNTLLGITDQLGLKTTYSYDAAKRLTRMIVGNEAVDYGYNSVGQLSSISNANDTIRRTHDQWGRLSSETSQGRTHTFAYNSFNELTNWFNGTLSTEYQYNVNGLMTSMTNSDGLYVFGWSKNGQLVSQQSPDGLLLSNQYDALGRLINRDYKNGSYVKQWQYGYNLQGLLTNITEDGFSQNYQYDPSQRLTAANTLTGDYSYQYDSLGNRLDFGGVYNSAGYLLEDNEFNYEYDARGNRTKKISKDGTTIETYTYNDLARLTGYQRERINNATNETTIETNASYAYDPLGRRIQKTVDGNLTEFVWLGQKLIEETTAGDMQSYQYGPIGYAPLSTSKANTTSSVVSDHLSAPVALLEQSQEIWNQQRSPFGIDVTHGQGSHFNLGLPGQYFDSESGLKYNYFRDYDPELGRYIQFDPIGLAGGINTYSYALNNPMYMVDPSGEIAIALPLIPIVLTGTDLAIGAGLVCIVTDCGSAIGESLGEIWYNNENSNEPVEPRECPYPENPDSSPDNFSPIKGKRGKLNESDGSVWERDHSSHGGEQWKRWKNKKRYEKNPRKPDNSIWPDGKVRK